MKGRENEERIKEEERKRKKKRKKRRENTVRQMNEKTNKSVSDCGGVKERNKIKRFFLFQILPPVRQNKVVYLFKI